jgi:hypothetical protein
MQLFALLGRGRRLVVESLSTVGSWKQAGWGACETVGLGGLMRRTRGLGSATTLRVAATEGLGIGICCTRMPRKYVCRILGGIKGRFVCFRLGWDDVA